MACVVYPLTLTNCTSLSVTGVLFTAFFKSNKEYYKCILSAESFTALEY